MFYFGSKTITSRELQHCTPIYTHDLSSVKFCRLFFAKWIKCPTHFNFDAVDGDGLDQMNCKFSRQSDFKGSTNRIEARFVSGNSNPQGQVRHRLLLFDSMQQILQVVAVSFLTGSRLVEVSDGV